MALLTMEIRTVHRPRCHRYALARFSAVALTFLLALPTVPRARAEAHMATVVVAGSVETALRSAVQYAIEQVIGQTAQWSLAVPLSPKAAGVLVDCSKAASPWACVAPALQGTSIARVLTVTLERDRSKEKSTAIWLTARLLSAEAAPALATRYCEACTAPGLTVLAGEAARELIATSIARAGATRIDVRTVPAGAIINLDTQMIGASNQIIVTSPGIHDLYLQLAGYQPEVRRVVAEAGKTVAVDVTFKPVTPTAPTDPPVAAPPASTTFETPLLPRWAPPALLGTGALALGLGTWLAVTAAEPAQGQVQKRYNYSVGGLVLAATGGAAAAAGLSLWRWPLTRTRSTRNTRSTGPSGSKLSPAALLSPFPGGLTAAVVGHF
jgi:PEGA domain